MSNYPKVIVSSVIRSSHQGESHGGVYIVDLETDRFEQVIDWNDQGINWAGRGGDRGLRGIALSEDEIFMVSSDEVFVYEKSFRPLESYKNRYLKHCHEICIDGKSLFIASTGYDAVLEFDLTSRVFVRGYCLRFNQLRRYLYKLGIDVKPDLHVFDPNSDAGPRMADTLHINNVYHSDNRLYVSGSKLRHLFSLKNQQLFAYANIPYGSHNPYPFRDGVLLNDTASDKVVYLTRNGKCIEPFAIKTYPQNELVMFGLPEDHARQGFGRGLCVYENELIIGGSSPATVSVYRFGISPAIKTINITMDTRNAIHGLAIWPY